MSNEIKEKIAIDPLYILLAKIANEKKFKLFQHCIYGYN